MVLLCLTSMLFSHNKIRMLFVILVSAVKVIKFSQLISYLSPGTDHQAVLRCLQMMAVLVQGCWVLKRLLELFELYELNYCI